MFIQTAQLRMQPEMEAQGFTSNIQTQHPHHTLLLREATNILIDRNTTNSNIIILSHCRAALQSLQSEARDEVVEIIFRNLGQLQTNNTLAMQWIPAHCGLFGNEEADRLAKDGSSKPQSPAKISFQETKTL